MSKRTGFGLLLALALTAGGCSKGSEKKQVSEHELRSGAARGSGAATMEAILGGIPASSRAALVVADWKRLFGLVASLEKTFEQRPLGRDLFKKVRLLRAAAPMPVPLSVEELGLLGLDAGGPLVVFGREQPVIRFPLRDVATFKQQLGNVWGRGEKTEWAEHSEGGFKLDLLKARHQHFCQITAERALCSPSSEALLEALREPTDRSLWQSLTAEEQRAIGAATVVLHGVGDQGRGLAAMRVEDDGISLQLGLRGTQLRAVTGLLANKGSAELLGLGQGARTILHLRLEISSLLALARGVLPDLNAAGFDAVQLQAALTGEILALERGQSDVAVIVRSRDAAVARETVEAVARLLEPGPRGRKGQAGRELPPVKLSRLEGKGGSALYKLTLAAPRKDLALPGAMGLGAGPLGIVLGSLDTVRELVQLEAPPPAGAFLAALDSVEEREAFGERALIATRSSLGDPLGPAAPLLDTVLQAASAPPAVRQGVELGRFLLDQMHAQTLGVLREGDDALRLVLRLSTLHRDGQAEDDEARALWQKGLAAKYTGNLDELQGSLDELAKRFSKTRYGDLKRRNEGGTLAAALVGLASAIAVPAFVKYTQRSKTVEAYQNLSRIVSAAKFAHGEASAGGAAARGSRGARGRFPASAGWAPAVPCCKGDGGRCRPRAADWAHPTWKALSFSLDEPHYFQYRFISKKTGFVAEARADIDCNGVFSSFSIEGRLGPDGEVTLAPMKVERPEE